MAIVGAGAADRLLQCGEPADRARHGAAEGDRGAAGDGRVARPADRGNCCMESLVLSLASAALLGIGLAMWIDRALIGFLPPG